MLHKKSNKKVKVIPWKKQTIGKLKKAYGPRKLNRTQ